MTEFVTITEKEYSLLTTAKKNALTQKDWEILVEYGDVFLKFLDKTRFSYQISLSEWTFRGKEEKIYNIMEWIEEIKQSIAKIPVSMQKHQEQEAEKQREKDLKKESK